MSGGHFDYNQYRISEIADEITRFIETNDDTTMDTWGGTRGRQFPPEVIARFREAAYVLTRAREMAQRVDWLVSGDDGIENFIKRWDESVPPPY